MNSNGERILDSGLGLFQGPSPLHSIVCEFKTSTSPSMNTRPFQRRQSRRSTKEPRMSMDLIPFGVVSILAVPQLPYRRGSIRLTEASRMHICSCFTYEEFKQISRSGTKPPATNRAPRWLRAALSSPKIISTVFSMTSLSTIIRLQLRVSQSLFSAANLQVCLARVHAACRLWWHGHLIAPCLPWKCPCQAVAHP